MANSKISALTSAATVAGTEVLPIVQSSATVKVAISDLNPGLSTITAIKGGTGQTSYAVGDLLYANTTTTLAKLADVATGNALISGGVSTAPSYGKIGLTTHVSGTLPVANGGTATSTAFTTGSVVFAGASGVYSQNNASFFWDNTNSRLGIGTATPAAKLHSAQTYVVPSSGGISADTTGIFSNNNIASGTANVSILSRSSGYQRLYFGNQTVENAQYIESFGNGGATGYLAFGVSSNSGTAAGTERMRISYAGGISIGSTTDAGVGNLLMGTGNITQGTAAKGVNFTANTPAAGMTSQLLNWYEHGTWTPNQGGGLTVVGAFTSSGTYTRIGRQVVVNGVFNGATSIAVAAGGTMTSNLPFTVLTTGIGSMANSAFTQSGIAGALGGGTSVAAASAITATASIIITITYFV
jgi:hypothetical protein